MKDIPPPPPPHSLIDGVVASSEADKVDPDVDDTDAADTASPVPIEDLIEGIPPKPASIDQIEAGSSNAAELLDLPYPPEDLPPARAVELPGRGTTHMRMVNGPPGAPTLLLLHGWTANSALNWFTSYTPLAQHFRIVALDHRGHGRGIRAPEPFTLADCADDAAALVDLLALGPVIAVGYSMGGPIAQLLAQRHPELVAGLVLCATASSFSGKSPGERAMQGVVTGLTFAARRAPESFNKRIADRVLVSRYDDSALGLWAREEARLNDPRSIVEAGQALSQFSSERWIARLAAPTAVVITERDHVVAPERQEMLAAAIPGAVRYPIDGDHDVVATDPDTFVPSLMRACLDVARRIGARSGEVDADDQVDMAASAPSASPAPTSTTTTD